MTVTRKVGSVVLALTVTTLGGVAAAGASWADDSGEPSKAYVCKYVGTPGDGERLQTGQNPIDVSLHAISESPVFVGSYFADKQGRSYVLAFDLGQPEPAATACPGTDPSPSGSPSGEPSVTPTPTPSGVTPSPSLHPTFQPPAQTITPGAKRPVSSPVRPFPKPAQPVALLAHTGLDYRVGVVLAFGLFLIAGGLAGIAASQRMGRRH